MDAFISELFDVTGVDYLDFVDETTGGLSHSALMRDTRLIENAAFRFTWSVLSGGALPSARCFAEFLVNHPVSPLVSSDSFARWILTCADGPFHILQGTALMEGRVASLRDGRFDSHLLALRDCASGLLHRSIVEKLVDRHSCSQPRLARSLSLSFMDKPLFVVYRDLTSLAGIASINDQITNAASGMIGSAEEESQMQIESSSGSFASGCRALRRIGRGDAMKRRFSRDLHFQRRQFAQHYLSAPSCLKVFADVVRVAIDAPWVVDESIAMDVEQHSPVIASSCVRLHLFGKETLRPPAKVIRDPTGPLPCSILIVFGAAAHVHDAELAALAQSLGYQRVLRAFTDEDSTIIHQTFDRNAGIQMVYPIFFGAQGTDHWSYGVLSASLRSHTSSQCPLQSLKSCDSHLLVDRCILCTALSRRIFHSPLFVIGSPDRCRRVILAIDSRHDPSATVLSIAIALSSIASTSEWHVRVLCSRRNKQEFQSMLQSICHGATFDDTSSELNVPANAFDVESCYNSLMKDPVTWRALLPADMVLTVQDDGLLIRSGIESIIDDGVDYVGAPWADHAMNIPLKSMIPTLVGNGGLSLRNVRAMISMSEGISDRERRRLFHNRLEPTPEDVTFSCLAYHAKCLANAAVAAAAAAAAASASAAAAAAAAATAAAAAHAGALPSLSCEQIPCSTALGFHKPWPYWTVTQTFEHMELIISESASINCSALQSVSRSAIPDIPVRRQRT